MTEPRDARSALNLRLVFASFGLILSLPLAVWAAFAGWVVPAILLGVLALIALVDLFVIQHRRRQRYHEEPKGTHHSLFE
ncbi:DUF6343 family protein [Hamadaea tsunoensis]|uniref:DUF6343 family protein n=1 Tax=Hamadaea tsunoensis TaxID=53368 RepID=UPI0003F98BD7|nr:DUF6343 family protein [Hamadaea tsunoensis]